MPALFLLGLAGAVERLAEIARAVAGRDQFRIERIVEFAREHLVPFRRHVKNACDVSCCNV